MFDEPYSRHGAVLGRRLGIALILTMSVALASCGDNGSDTAGLNGPGGNGGGGSGQFHVSAQIDGNSWTATELQTTYFADRITFNSTNDHWRILVQVRGFDGPGTYPLSSAVPIATITVHRHADLGVWGGVSALGEGLITITSASQTRVAGTFSGVFPLSPGIHISQDTVRVQNGSFDVPRTTFSTTMGS
jgi:hypothetical protein